MRIHACLNSEVAAFDFGESDLHPLRHAFPHAELRLHADADRLWADASGADYLLAWEFRASWYARFANLKTIFTPAAGRDWVAPDPRGRVEVRRGRFHGPLLAESLLEAVLFMNRCMPDMIRNHGRQRWDRNLQRDCRLIANQTLLIVGFGRIGNECARLFRALGAQVIGVKRDPTTSPASIDEVAVHGVDELDALLPRADHVVVLLPGEPGSEGMLDERRLRLCRPGVYVYNFGRGNALASRDIIHAADHIGGAFLDVVDQEPLDPDSALWGLDQVMITPHSSCVYREYKPAFLAEVIEFLSAATT